MTTPVPEPLNGRSRADVPGRDTGDGPARRCADAAEAAGDPMEGTAPPADHWFLVEHPGPWDRYILAGSGIDRAVAGTLDRWARVVNGRVLLVRRPGRQDRPVQRRWFRIDGRPGHESVRSGLFTAEAELPDVVADPGAGDTHDGRLVLVCTHGRHDTCCAVRGRPLASATAAVLPECTWESSHLGGCRFAGALVLLPHGIVLGGVSAGDGPEAALRYARGLVPHRGVRGRASLAPVVQTAQHHARLTTGSYEVDALRPVDAVADGADTWHVRFSDPEVTVVLRERRVDTGRPLTCAATSPGWMRVFDLLEVTVTAAPRATTSR